MTTLHYQAKSIARHRRVVGTGLVALDVLLGDKACSDYAALGGSTGNVLAILAFLGWSAIPVAQLGKDPAGSRIQLEFESLNVDTSFIAFEESIVTPVVYQSPGDLENTHKFSFSCPFCGKKRSFIPATDELLCHLVLNSVPKTDVFYFDRVTPWSLILAEGYRRRGALVMFEPSSFVNDSGDFQRAIQACHILKYADDRISQLEAFNRDTVEVEIQTLGAQGLQYRTRHGNTDWTKLGVLSVPIISDTAGAGDWCSAGMLHFLSSDISEGHFFPQDKLKRSLRFGQALAALNCMHSGARGLARQLSENHLHSLMGLECMELLNEKNDDQWRRVCQSILVANEDRNNYEKKVKSSFSRDIDEGRLCCEPLLRAPQIKASL